MVTARVISTEWDTSPGVKRGSLRRQRDGTVVASYYAAVLVDPLGECYYAICPDMPGAMAYKPSPAAAVDQLCTIIPEGLTLLLETVRDLPSPRHSDDAFVVGFAEAGMVKVAGSDSVLCVTMQVSG